MTGTTTLVKLNNPFNIEDRTIQRLTMSEVEPLSGFLVKYAAIPSEMEYHASINGRVYAPEEIPLYQVMPGDCVVVCPVLRGGGGSKNPLAILAGLALAIFSFGAVAPIFTGIFGGSVIAGNIAAGLTLMIGGQLISNAFSPSLNPIRDSADNSTSPSYGWGALQSITQQGAVIPMTYGTVRTAGQVLNQHVTVDEDNETQYLEMLMCGGEGPIDSFTDVRINDNPIANYENAEYYTRSGANTQSVITGFEKLYDTQAVGVTLDSDDEGGPGDWFTVEMTGDTVDYIELGLDFPQGLAYYSGEKAEPDEVTVEVEFEYARQLSENSWTAWMSGPSLTVTAASINPITRVIRTGTLNSARYRVRGRVASKSQTDTTKARTTTSWSSLTAVINSPMTHPNKALVGVRVQATDQLNGGAPTITWRQTRNNVWVWNGTTWTQQNAQNPAWIIYDLCVQARQLDGVIYVFGDDPSRMDYGAFASWAAWNDRTLNNRPAMRMNLLVDESKSLWQWVNDIAASARGAVVMKGTRISCIWDQPSNPVQLFSMGNIIAGSFSGEYLPVESRANAVEISFQNEDKNFEREQITVYADHYNDEDSRANPVAVELTGITDYERAYREGLYRLRQNKYILRTISFSADVDAIACQVGDVINVQHDVPQWGRGGRIMAIDGNQLTLDNEVTFNPGLSYNIMVRTQDDTIIERAVTGEGTTNVITVSSASGISPYDVFSFGEVQKVAKPFRVQTMSRSADSQVMLTCSEYIAAVYTDDGDIPVINYSEATDQIAHLRLTPTGYYTQSGQWVPELWATWTYRGEKPASYQVEWKYDNGLWGQRVNTMETSAQCPLRSTVSLYSVRVRALYASAAPSDWAYATAESSMLGDGIPPAAPQQLTAEGWFGFAELNWVNPPDIDLDYIEVWENTEDNLQTATLVGTTSGSSYSRLLGAGGVTFYWVRAVNYTRQKSPFNSQAGTHCIIAPESHEAYVEELLKANPWLQDIIGDLNQQIEDIDAKIEEIEEIDPLDIQSRLDELDALVPEMDGRIKDNQDAIQNNIYQAIDAVASGVLRLDDEAYRTRNVFRWAGIEVNEKEGTVVIRGLEDLRTETGYQFSEVEERLDAQTASISLKASRTYVDEMAASLISSVITAEEWKFEGTLDGWTGQNATLTATSGGISYAITGADPAMTSPDISIDGSINNIIGLQLRQTVGDPNATVRVQYKTASHGYSDSYMKRVLIVGDMNLTRSVQVNMYALDAGGDDWQNSTITGIRILIGEDVGAEYLVSLVNIGQSSINELALGDLELRITQAEIDIDGANAAIQLKADQTTVTALSQELRTARVDIDAMNARVELKADKTTVNDMETRLEYAEVKADAALGYVSLAVADSILPQEQIDNIAEAALQNAVTDAQNQEKRRGAIALARQELHAEVEDAKHAAAEYRLQLIAMVDGNKAITDQQIQVLTTDLNAEVNARETLAVAVNDNTAAIEAERQARISADNAEATQRQTLAVKVNQNTSAIQTEAQTRASADQAEAQARQTLQTKVNQNTAAIQTEATARATADNAEVQARQTLATKVNNNTAAIQTETQARVNADKAEATARQTLATKVNNNTAAIQNETAARINADKAEAQARQTLQASVNSNTAKIQQTSQALATLDGQVSAKWTVKTDVNGNVAGLELFNGGQSKTAFVVAADHFMITRPGVNNPKQIFDYDSTTASLYIKNAYMDWGYIKNARISGAQIQDATITNAKIENLTLTKGKIGYEEVTQTRATTGLFSNNGSLSTYNKMSPAVYPTLGGSTNCAVLILYGFSIKSNNVQTASGGKVALYRNGSQIQDTTTFSLAPSGDTYIMHAYTDQTSLSGSQQYYFVVGWEDPGEKKFNCSYPFISATVLYR